MKVLRFIDGKLAGWQYAKRETVAACTEEYPFRKEGDEGNQVAWAKRWASHGQENNEVRMVEIIEDKDWNEASYEKHVPVKEVTLKERIDALEKKIKDKEEVV